MRLSPCSGVATASVSTARTSGRHRRRRLDEGFRGTDDELGEGAVDVDAHARDVGADVGPAGGRPRVVGRRGDVVHGDLVADGEPFDAGPQQVDPTGRLVPGHPWEGDLGPEAAGLQEVVGAADAAGLDANAHLTGAGLRQGTADKAQRGADRRQLDRTHAGHVQPASPATPPSPATRPAPRTAMASSSMSMPGMSSPTTTPVEAGKGARSSSGRRRLKTG